MPIFKYCTFLIISCALLLGCRDKQREAQLASREEALMQKERDFALKQADYRSLLRMRDSLLTRPKDTIVIQTWPDEIAGMWNSKSVCRESNCPEYVVGDQRFNMWEFVSDSTGLFTRVFDKNSKLVRIYSAQYDSTGIQLRFAGDSSATGRKELRVDLSQVNPDFIRGMQSIAADKGCNAKFSIELNRSTNR